MRPTVPAVDTRLTYDDREYWLVDPELDTVQVLRLTAQGRLARVEELTAEDGGTLTTPLLPGCGIDVRALFRPTLTPSRPLGQRHPTSQLQREASASARHEPHVRTLLLEPSP